MYVRKAYNQLMAMKSERLNLRLSRAQDAVLRRAAEAKGESISDYVLRHAVVAAETDLADRRVFVVDEVAWKALQKRLDQPPKPAAELEKLLHDPSVLDGP